MLELLRTFFGYCSSCHMPKVVGEFKVAGWNYVFNICDACMQKRTDQLIKAETEFMERENYTGSRL